MTNVIPNEYILGYSAAFALMYIKKYLYKIFHDFKIQSIANINFLEQSISNSQMGMGSVG